MTSITCYRAESRPGLWQALEDGENPLNLAWPLFLDQNFTFKKYVPKLLEIQGLSRFQFAIVEQSVEGNEVVIGCGRSIPFFSPELQTHLQLRGGQWSSFSQEEIETAISSALPDGGYDTILARGVEQASLRQQQSNLPSKPLGSLSRPSSSRSSPSEAFMSSSSTSPSSITPPSSFSSFFSNDSLTAEQLRESSSTWLITEKPNALCALSVTVHPERRSQGFAEMIIEKMKQAAREAELTVLVVPLRPTCKQKFPTLSMSEYISWIVPKSGEKENGIDYPFDPWLRKHVRLGGRVIKVAPRSMVVTGTIQEWQEWTSVSLDFDEKKDGAMITFPGGLVPLEYQMKEGQFVYTEPNVWLYHNLG